MLICVGSLWLCCTERGSGLSISTSAIRHIMDVPLCYWEKILPGIIHLQKFNCYIKGAGSPLASALALIRDFSLSSLVYNAIKLVRLLSYGWGNGKKAPAIANMDSAYWTQKSWKDKLNIFLHEGPGSDDVFIHACVLAGYCGLFFLVKRFHGVFVIVCAPGKIHSQSTSQNAFVCLHLVSCQCKRLFLLWNIFSTNFNKFGLLDSA